jgi:hypothetical protein
MSVCFKFIYALQIRLFVILENFTPTSFFRLTLIVIVLMQLYVYSGLYAAVCMIP